jgi:hypothetical protein
VSEGTETWRPLFVGVLSGRLFRQFASDRGQIAYVPEDFLQAFIGGAVIDAALVPAREQPEMLELWRGGRVDASFPASLLPCLLQMREERRMSAGGTPRDAE